MEKMARSLIDPYKEKVYIPLLNLHAKSLTISSNSVIGTLESVNLIHPIDQTVNPNDEQNTDETSSVNNSECLPEHLEIMMEHLSANWSQEQYQKLKHVLIRNQEIFSILNFTD